MATRLQLRTRLKSRLGLGVVSAVEATRLDEAINSGLARALSDGAAGLTYSTFVGATFANLALTNITITAKSNQATSGVATFLQDNVFPQDILVVVDGTGNETKFIIREVVSDTALDIGLEAPLTIAGGSSSYIIRRALVLPNSGQLLSISRVNGSRYHTLSRVGVGSKSHPFDTGSGRFFEQRYSEGQGKSFISLWPAPNDTSERYVVAQTEFKVRMDQDTDTLAFPEEALDGILERARGAYLTWIGSATEVELRAASQASRDVADSLENSGAAFQGHQKI